MVKKMNNFVKGQANMTPLQLSILIHYTIVSDDDYNDGNFSDPDVRAAIDWLKNPAEMLEMTCASDNPDSMYRLTDKGKCFVNHICNLPLPIYVWMMPEYIFNQDETK